MKWFWRYFYFIGKYHYWVSWVFLASVFTTDSAGTGLLTIGLAWSFRWKWLWEEDLDKLKERSEL